MLRRFIVLLATCGLLWLISLLLQASGGDGGPEPATDEFISPNAGSGVTFDELSTKRAPASEVMSTGVITLLRIVVLTIEEVPIAGVRIAGVGRSVPHAELGETDAAGQFSVESVKFNEHGYQWLSVEKQGYAAQTVVVPDSIPESITVRLRPDAVIKGQALLVDGTPAGPGITIACWPRGTEPLTYEAARESLLSRTSTRIATTGDDGCFEISGLEQHEYYSVGAGGRGLSAGHVSSGIRAGTQNLKITIYQIHASVLTFRSSLGHSRQLFQEGQVQPAFRSWSRIKAKLSIPKSTVALADSGEYLRTVPEDRYLQLWATDRYSENLAGITVECTIPGFVPIRAEYSANALQNGVAEHVVELVSDGAACGRVGVRFTRAAVPAEEGGLVSEFAPRAKLILGSPGSALEWVAVIPRPDESGIRWIEGVKHGSYLVRVAAVESDFRSPSVAVVVGDDHPEPVIIDIAVDELGALRIDYERRFPVSWKERPAVVLGSAGVPIVKDGVQGIVSRGMARFASDDTLIRGVPSGDYLVFPFEMSEGDSFAETIQRPVHISPGATTTLWMPLTWP